MDCGSPLPLSRIAAERAGGRLSQRQAFCPHACFPCKPAVPRASGPFPKRQIAAAVQMASPVS